MEEHISKIIEIIRKKEMVVFCGAGISRNSGLPLVSELCRLIFSRLNVESNDAEALMNSGLPFEALMELVSSVTDISGILEIYREGEPNTTHILLATLARQGFIKNIVTTNFDTHIEKALDLQGLKRGKHYSVYYSEQQFPELNLVKPWDKKIRVLKIHGSVEDMKSIRTTMKVIAAQKLSEGRIALIRRTFFAGENKHVLILGYSCSDVFDISSHIEDIKEEGWFYLGDVKVVLLKKLLKDNRKANRVVLEKLASKYEIDVLNVNLNRVQEEELLGIFNSVLLMPDFHELVDANLYRKALPLNARQLLDQAQKDRQELTRSDLARLNRALLTAIYPRVVRKRRLESKKEIWLVDHAEKGMETEDIRKKPLKNPFNDFSGTRIICNTDDFIRLFWKLYRRFAGGYSLIKNEVEWRPYVDRWARQLESDNEYLKFYIPGLIFYSTSFFKLAVDYFEKTLKHIDKRGNRAVESECYIKLGYISCDLKNYEKAVEYGKKTMDIVPENSAAQAECYHLLAVAYSYVFGYPWEKAMESCNKALDLAAGRNKALEARCCLLLAKLHKSLSGPGKVFAYLDKVSEIASEIGDKSLELEYYIFRGSLSEIPDRIDYWKIALDIAKKIGKKHKEADCYVYLGQVYNRVRNFSKAIDCLTNAERIAGKTGQRLSSSVSDHLKIAYEGIGNIGKAEECNRKREFLGGRPIKMNRENRDSFFPGFMV